jgi:hypothetical protein
LIGRVSDDASSQALVSQTTNLGVGRSDRSGCTIKNKALAPSRKKQNMPVPHWCPGWGSGSTCNGRGSSVLWHRFRPPGRVRDCRSLVDPVGNASQRFANQCSGGVGGGIRAATCYEACSGFGGKPMRNPAHQFERLFLRPRMAQVSCPSTTVVGPKLPIGRGPSKTSDGQILRDAEVSQSNVKLGG